MWRKTRQSAIKPADKKNGGQARQMDGGQALPINQKILKEVNDNLELQCLKRMCKSFHQPDNAQSLYLKAAFQSTHKGLYPILLQAKSELLPIHSIVGIGCISIKRRCR
jgi:hypothetical protein